MTLEIRVGALLRKHVRNQLDNTIFKGYDLKYRENKYFLESEFIIKTDDKNVYDAILKYCKRLED